ncbi:MAG: VOC family protein [Thermomicrobiaceae bacterium]|nr:VOC family protein [Thermomicrobiaceae bacterium]
MPLTQVRLLVTHFDECFKFYRDVLGLHVLWGAPGARFAGFRAGEGASVALLRREEMSGVVGTTDLPAEASAQDRVALVFTVTDLDDSVALLERRGVHLIDGPEDRPAWGVRAAHLRDPDGNLIELSEPIPVEEWSEELQAAARRYEQR